MHKQVFIKIYAIASVVFSCWLGGCGESSIAEEDDKGLASNNDQNNNTHSNNNNQNNQSENNQEIATPEIEFFSYDKTPLCDNNEDNQGDNTPPDPDCTQPLDPCSFIHDADLIVILNASEMKLYKEETRDSLSCGVDRHSVGIVADNVDVIYQDPSIENTPDIRLIFQAPMPKINVELLYISGFQQMMASIIQINNRWMITHIVGVVRNNSYEPQDKPIGPPQWDRFSAMPNNLESLRAFYSSNAGNCSVLRNDHRRDYYTSCPLMGLTEVNP